MWAVSEVGWLARGGCGEADWSIALMVLFACKTSPSRRIFRWHRCLVDGQVILPDVD